MDDRTADLLGALQHPGAAVLFELTQRTAAEAELIAAARGATQATTNRRLERFERLGLIERAPGRAKAPGRAWNLVHPAETEALLSAALALGAAAPRHDAKQRDRAARQLRQARAKRLGVRRIEGDG